MEEGACRRKKRPWTKYVGSNNNNKDSDSADDYSRDDITNINNITNDEDCIENDDHDFDVDASDDNEDNRLQVAENIDDTSISTTTTTATMTASATTMTMTTTTT